MSGIFRSKPTPTPHVPRFTHYHIGVTGLEGVIAGATGAIACADGTVHDLEPFGSRYRVSIPLTSTNERQPAMLEIKAVDHEPFELDLVIDRADDPIELSVVLARRRAPRPSREQVRHVRGAIALDQTIFAPFYLAQSDDERARWRSSWKALDLTHVIVMLSGEYRGRFPWFWLWHDVDRVRALLQELRDDGFVNILWAANGESFRASELSVTALDAPVDAGVNVRLTGPQGFDRRTGPREVTIEQAWNGLLPAIADLLDAAVPAPEMNDIWTPAQQHRRTQLLRALLPDVYLLVHFTRGRSHGDNNRGTGPAGDPPPEWSPEPDLTRPGQMKSTLPGYWRGSPFVDGLFHNLAYAHLTNEVLFVSDLGDVSVRVNGRVPVPGKRSPYPGMQRDVIYGEGPAEWILKGDWLYARGDRLRALALTVPGVSGFGD